MNDLARALSIFFLSLSLCAGCGDDTANGNPDANDQDGRADGFDGGGDDGGQPGDAGDDGGGDEFVDPCEGVDCPDDQHCEDDGSGQGVCVNNSCDDLACGPTEICETTPGGGAVCVDIGCSQDIECPVDQHCNGTICVDDVCEPGFQQCQGAVVEECLPNGSAFEARFACGSMSSFESVCVDDGQGTAYCTCEDDWDCPQWTGCDVGVCRGTGREPTCSLPAEPFTDVLPTAEITWGGTAADPTAQGSPFPNAAQVVITPVVANLDDDNGDGLIDEKDFPEIVFLTFRNSEYTTNGVLRAIHGGGPGKGGDFFAVCGATTWHEGDDLGMACAYTDADIDSTSSPAVGDLDNDGVPEIVAVTENDGINIYRNTGDRMSTNTAGNLGGPNPAVAIANVDNRGFAEIVIGRSLFTLQDDGSGNLSVLDRFEGTETAGRNGQGPVSCVANLVGDEQLEIVGGSVAYRWPAPPAGAASRADCTGAEVDPDEVAWCGGELLVVWDAQAVNGSVAERDGFCAVADVLGLDPALAPGPGNPLDGLPEVLLIANGYLEVFDGATGTMYREIGLAPGTRGGAPNVDDFDGDGFPELGTAFETAYILYDFQEATAGCPAWPTVMQDEPSPGANPPRAAGGTPCSDDSDCVAGEAVCNPKTSSCVCLYNDWRRSTEDDSSRVTGSSVFDFNGDGGAEVVYNDECFFRVYNGLDGNVLFEEPSESRTRIEYPIVVDVDNDGNAEIVFGTSNESGFCSENMDNLYNAGIEVWGDAGDYWVSARRVWNQHAYHVTNVLEDASIPVREPASWRVYNGRIYNTYRSNPRNYNTAPDLTVTAIQFSSPDAACGQLSDSLDITVQVENVGDLIVGPSLVVAFEGRWTSPPVTEMLLDGNGDRLEFVLQSPLEPGDAVFANVSYHAANNPQGTLPEVIRAFVDADGRERECNETNNDLEADVVPGELAADLRVELGAADQGACPNPTIETTVYNDGSLPASDVVVRYYAGDPDQGGTVLHEELVTGPIDPGGSVTFTATLVNFPTLLITVFAVVDPDNAIFECNDGDNQAQGPQLICFET